MGILLLPVPFSNHCQCWLFCHSRAVSFETCCQWHDPITFTVFLTCIHDHLCAYTQGGLAHRHFDSEKLTIFFLVLMTEFEPQVFGSWVQCSTNWATPLLRQDCLNSFWNNQSYYSHDQDLCDLEWRSRSITRDALLVPEAVTKRSLIMSVTATSASFTPVLLEAAWLQLPHLQPASIAHKFQLPVNILNLYSYNLYRLTLLK